MLLGREKKGLNLRNLSYKNTSRGKNFQVSRNCSPKNIKFQGWFSWNPGSTSKRPTNQNTNTNPKEEKT